jgi:enhanced disease susceptibility 1 protein
MPTDTPAPLPQRAASLSDDDRLLVAHCAELSFPSHTPAPPPAPATPAASAPARGSFQVHHASHPYPCAAFAFAPSWSAADWAAPSSAGGARHPFGDAEVDPALFPSLRAVGSGVPARANAAFLDSFRGLLDGSTLQSEVSDSSVGFSS